MCLNCGCGQPSNRHDSAANITAGDVKAASKTAAHKSGTGGGLVAAASAIHKTVRKRK